MEWEKISRQLSSGEVGRDSLTLLTGAWGRFFYRREKANFVEDSLWQDLDPIDWIATKFSDNVWMNPTVWLVSRRLTELAGPWDERLTTEQAEQAMVESGYSRRDQRRRVDAVAAAVILQSYLDREAESRPSTSDGVEM